MHGDVTKSDWIVHLCSAANEALFRYLKLNLNKYFATKSVPTVFLRKETKTCMLDFIKSTRRTLCS